MTSRSGWKTLRWRGLLVAAVLGLALVGTHPLKPAAAQDAEPAHREMELQRYRDAVRRHFVLKEYEELLELTEKYGHLYPEDRGTEFYRTQAEIRIEEAEREIPFQRLEDRKFRIPGADAGQPSLLDELRNGSGSESGAGGSSGLTVEPGRDSQIAMGTAPSSDELQSPFERPTPLEDGEETAAGPSDFTTPEAAPGESAAEASDDADPAPALPSIPEQTGAVEEGEPDSGGSPLPLILGGSVLVLGAVAAFLLIGMARRSKRAEAVEEAAPAGAGAEPAAPPLFNFDDAEASDEGGTSEFDSFEPPEPFEETGVAAETGAGEAEASASGAASESLFDASGESEPPEALGETRGTEEVNQEISDLLFAPGESGEDSVFGTGSDAPAEPPPPLGETKSEETAFGSPGDDTSDLVQIPDDSNDLESGSDVDDPFADVSPGEKSSGAEPAEAAPEEKQPAKEQPPEPAAETSVNDLSSIDLFGEGSAGQAEAGAASEESDSTSNVDMDEVDALITESGGGSSSGEVDFTEPSGEEGGGSDGIEIPFAMEDPFTNLSGNAEESEPRPQDDETAFNTSTAETLAAQGADTGVEERELLEVIEEGEGETRGGGEAPPAGAGGDDIWSALDSGAEQHEAPAEKPAPEDEVQSFREDETAAFEIDMGEETGQGPTPDSESRESELRESEPQMGEPQIGDPEAETVIPAGGSGTRPGDLPDDPFDRERQRGQQAVESGDWTKAVYHLSIAASLNPEANDVREELRHARRMKKEQQTG